MTDKGRSAHTCTRNTSGGIALTYLVLPWRSIIRRAILDHWIIAPACSGRKDSLFPSRDPRIVGARSRIESEIARMPAARYRADNRESEINARKARLERAAGVILLNRQESPLV